MAYVCMCFRADHRSRRGDLGSRAVKCSRARPEAKRLSRVAADGHCDIPADFATDEEHLLGKWLYRRRAEYRAGTLSDDRVVQLHALDVSQDGVSLGGWISHCRSHFRDGTHALPSRFADCGRLVSTYDGNPVDSSGSKSPAGRAHSRISRNSAEHGHTDIRRTHVTADGFHLGRLAGPKPDRPPQRQHPGRSGRRPDRPWGGTAVNGDSDRGGSGLGQIFDAFGVDGGAHHARQPRMLAQTGVGFDNRAREFLCGGDDFEVIEQGEQAQ